MRNTQKSRKWHIQVPHAQTNVEDPLGYTKTIPVISSGSTASKDAQSGAGNQQLQEKKAWELAQSPFKTLLMTGFLMWMSGNQVNIFPIIITVMALINPFKALFSTNAVFKSFEEEGVAVTLPKLVYFGLNCVGVALAVYKCNNMGLLPQQSDWANTTPLEPQEFSVPIL
ncbi:hypothetical protein AKO1_011257 [Acrasis kona]|uniref:ER membrane protein complex subunit 4 n=1 Tax=Acrasis kona TaxID=1008807 RepID=A0AAW2YVL7_9EUKA